MKLLRFDMGEILGDLKTNFDFLRLFSGHLVTNAGDSLYYIAIMWLVFEMTGSPFLTGLAGFFSRLPSVVSFLIGPLVDRWPLKRVLVVTQLLNSLLILFIPIAFWSGHGSVWLLLTVLPFVTLINQFVYPANDAAFPLIVTDENLTKANSLMSAGKQSANLVFNALSGVLIALTGALVLFVINSITFIVALLLFATLKDTSLSGTQGDDSDPDGDQEERSRKDVFGDYLQELKSGFSYVRGSSIVIFLIGVVITNMTGGALLGVLPAYAGTIGGPSTYGFLMAAYAGGTLTGAVLSSKFNDQSFGWVTSIGISVSGLSLAVAVLVPWFPATLLFFYLTFVPVGMFNVLFFSMLQSVVQQDFLGRVSSLVRSVAMTAIPVGSVLGGAVASALGSRYVLFSWTLGAVFFGLYVAAHGSLRSLPPIPQIDESVLRIDGTPSGDDQ